MDDACVPRFQGRAAHRLPRSLRTFPPRLLPAGLRGFAKVTAHRVVGVTVEDDQHLGFAAWQAAARAPA
jgi:hypothetical protein